MNKYILVLLSLVLISNLSYATDKILPDENKNAFNPYKHESWFKQIKLSQPEFGKIQPDFGAKYSKNSEMYSKYSNTLARLEREWFGESYSNLPEETRVSNLEEKVFGTIHDGSIEYRCNQLKKAFNARKSLQAQHRAIGKNMFSGVPTSIPIGADDLFGEW